MSGSPLARLNDGVTAEAAVAEITALLPQIRPSRPPAPVPLGSRPRPATKYELVGMQQLMVAPVRPALLVLTVTVGLVLLIACANVANLLLARVVARLREFAVRLAIGAGRGRLLRQLTESVLLAMIGASAGLALAYGGIQLLQALAGGIPRRDLAPGFRLPRLDEIAIDWRVLGFTLVVSSIAGVLFGLAPAYQRLQPNPMDALREGGGVVPSGFHLLRRSRAQGLLVVAEIAMAVMLFIGGALLIQSVVKLASVDPGFPGRTS